MGGAALTSVLAVPQVMMAPAAIAATNCPQRMSQAPPLQAPSAAPLEGRNCCQGHRPLKPDSGEIAAGGAGRLDWHRRAACLSDRKSTRLNSSHLGISYAVFC